ILSYTFSVPATYPIVFYTLSLHDALPICLQLGNDSLFLFCGSRTDHFKGLYWDGEGFVLLYKRFENGNLRWPRHRNDAVSLTSRSEEHTSELQSRFDLVCRLLLEKKNKNK